MPSKVVVVDISDNTARAAVISKLTGAAAARAPASPLPDWHVPADSAPHPTPVTGISNVWQQLNSLRVMAQYARILGGMCSDHPFLQGHPTTCVHGLEWFSRLAQPLLCPDERVCEGLTRTIDTFRQQQDPPAIMPMAQAAFEVNRRLACPDRSMMQLLLWYHFPLSSEFEVDICNHMLSRPDMTYQKWLAEFPTWRELGLYYPMVLAAMYMPGQEHWLPLEAHRTQLAVSFAHCLNALADPDEDHVSSLRELESEWEADDTGTAHVLGSTLDRLAVLMRVKSNGRPGKFDLAKALEAFPRAFGPEGAGMHESNYHAWLTLKSAVEATFPPSLMCTPLVRPKRHTWGFPSLTLRVGDGGEVFFRETDLQSTFLEAHQPCEGAGAVHYYTPVFAGECLMGQTSHRVQDVLWRLGEIVTSPEIALCMLHPSSASASMQGMPPPDHAERAADCRNRGATLNRMFLSSPHPKRKEEYMELTRRLDAAVPPVELKSFPETQAVLLWRLDIPSRAIVYLGDEITVDPTCESQHHLSKALVHSKVPQSPIGGICSAQGRANDMAVRGCLCTFAASGKLAAHPSNVVLVKADEADGDEDEYMSERQVVPIACTTLAESVACLALRPASRTTTCQLGGSCSWKEGGIDPRYAERQQADNGLRFRDWVALHAGKGGTQQSRLASHVVEFDSIYSTKMPWIQQSDDDRDQTVRWVRVASTAKPESKTLQGKTLRQAVESRFLHDLRMLPVRGELGAALRVERSNTELYSASECSVAIAYAPTGQSRLELMAFEVDP